MSRKAPKPARTWIKLYCAECIRGSIRTTLSPTERSVWYDLLLMAGDSRVDGVICATVGIPYPHRHIANTLAISLPLLQSCLKKFKDQDRLTEDDEGIHILKWHLYQRPYQSKLPWPEEGEKTPEKDKPRSEDPDKYIKGKYGHLVQR